MPRPTTPTVTTLRPTSVVEVARGSVGGRFWAKTRARITLR